MKKNIFKIIGLLALTMLIALNVTSTMKFSPGGQEVEARVTEDKIPCYSSYKKDNDYGFVYCATCSDEDGISKRAAGTCTVTRD